MAGFFFFSVGIMPCSCLYFPVRQTGSEGINRLSAKKDSLENPLAIM